MMLRAASTMTTTVKLTIKMTYRYYIKLYIYIYNKQLLRNQNDVDVKDVMVINNNYKLIITIIIW